MLAFLARRALQPPHTSLSGWLLYLAGAVLILGALRPSLPAARAETRMLLPGTAPRILVSITFGAIGLALAIVAYDRVRNGHPGRGTLIVWLVAVGSVLLGAASTSGRPRLRRPSPLPRPVLLECVAVGVVLVVALVVRFYDLGGRPAYIHQDEAFNALDARGFLTGANTEVLTTGLDETPRLSFAILAPAMRVFGDDLYGARAASAVLGVVAVLLLYALARRLFGVAAALFAAALLAVSQWAVHFSRVAITNEEGVVATLLVIFLAVRAADRNRLADWVLAGLSAGLCFEVYQAARLAPLVAAGYLVHRAVRVRSFLRARWAGLASAVLAAFVFVAPIAGYYVRYPERLNEHGREVSVWSSGPRAHEMSVYGVRTLPAVLVKQSERTLAALDGARDSSPQYGSFLTDGLSGPLVVLGLLLALALGLRDSRLFLIGEWSILTLAFGVVTINALDSTRVVGVMGAFCLAAAFVVELGREAIRRIAGRRGARAYALVVFAFLAAVAVVNIRDYFWRYPASHPEDSQTVLGRYAGTIQGGKRLYMLPGAGYSITTGVIGFLAPSLGEWNLPSAEPRRLPDDLDAVLVVPDWSPDSARERRWIRNRFVVASHRQLGPNDGSPFFDVYTVKKTTLTPLR